MRKISRRHRINLENTKMILASRIYGKKQSELEEAISILKKTANTEFVETFELHANLNINPRYSNQQLRTTVTLPNGNGKDIKIAVLTNEENFLEAKSAGASIVGHIDLIKDINEGNIKFDLLLTTPNMMPKLAKLGRILGPKGLMPSPKSGTVTTNLKNSLTEFKKGKFEYKSDKTGIVHASFGNINFTDEELLENINELYQSIEQNRPSGVKGKYFKSLFVSTTMGPSIQLDLNSFE